MYGNDNGEMIAGRRSKVSYALNVAGVTTDGYEVTEVSSQ